MWYRRGGRLRRRPRWRRGGYRRGGRAGMGAYMGRQRRRRAALRRRNWRSAGLLGLEFKAFDTVYAATALSTALQGAEAETTSYGLCCPTEGNAFDERDGRKILIKTIQMNGSVYRIQASEQDDVRQSAVVMVAVVQDRQTNGAQAQAEQCFDETPGDDGEPLAFKKMINSKRFKILWRRVFTLTDMVAMTDAANQASICGNRRNFKIYKRVNIPVNFVATNGNVADILDNSIHVFACASSAGCMLIYNSRVRFVG